MKINRKKFTAAASLVAVAAIATSVMGAIPANASAQSASNCGSGAACTWDDYNYVTNGIGSHLLGFQNSVSNYASYDYAGTTISANDSATSVYNNGNSDSAQFFVTKAYANYAFTLSINTGDADLNNTVGAVPTDKFNDQLSSAKFVS